MIYFWVFTFLLHVRLDSSNFVYMLHWKDWNWISNVCKVFSSSKKTLIYSFTACSLNSGSWNVQVSLREAACVAGVKRGKESKILARDDVENGNLFLSFAFFSLLARPSRSHAPNFRVPLPLLKLPRRLLLGDWALLLLSGF